MVQLTGPWQVDNPMHPWAHGIEPETESDAAPRRRERTEDTGNENDDKTAFDVSLWWRFVSEVFLGIKTTVAVCSCIGSGYRLFVLAVRLVLFTICLLPGFLKMVFWYYTSPRIVRGIAYGPKQRQLLDVYLPPGETSRPTAVVIFLTGGAWMIGYRAWGALLARRLCMSGTAVFCLDYRNFPTSAQNVMDMLEDVNAGIGWVLKNCSQYGGDADNVHLCGQSAGAHLGSLALLLQCQRCSRAAQSSETPQASPYVDVPFRQDTALPTPCPQHPALQQLTELHHWDPRHIHSFIGVSGPYNLPTLREHFPKVGLTKASFDKLMSIDGRPAIEDLSPLNVARNCSPAALRCLPEIHLLHGSRDKSIPCSISDEFAHALRDLGLPVELRIYKGGTHTSPLLEMPMRGGSDGLTDDILSVVFRKAIENEYAALCPDILINLATLFSPF